MQQQRKDLVIAPLCEALLILVAALAAWLSHKPLIFASLGPTAYEMIETPDRPSARPYNVIAGHLVAVLSAFAALWMSHGWFTPAVAGGALTGPRVLAVVLSAMFTVFGTLLARAGQPAALSTTLLVSSGVMQRPRDGFYIMAAVVLITIAGEPLRVWRERDRNSP